MSYQWDPPSSGNYEVYKKGQNRNGVAALQLNLGDLDVDGDFGPLTEGAVKLWQRDHGLTVDGIAGGATQLSIFQVRSRNAQAAYQLPQGLLRSIAQSESGCYLAAFSWHPSDSGFDVGVLQNSITPTQLGDQGLYERSYKATYMCDDTGAKVRQYHDRYDSGSDYVTSDRKAWELAVLVHNRPASAEYYYHHGTYGPNQDAPTSWAPQYTLKEWCDNYIKRGTVYVKW